MRVYCYTQEQVDEMMTKLQERAECAEAELGRLQEERERAISLLTHAVDDIDADDLCDLCPRVESDLNAEHERSVQAERKHELAEGRAERAEEELARWHVPDLGL
jgi:hypothetical protein